MPRKKKVNPHSGALALGWEWPRWNHDNTGGQKSGGYTVKDIQFQKRVRVTDAEGKVICDLPGWGLVSDWNAMKTQYGKDAVEVTGDVAPLTETIVIPDPEVAKACSCVVTLTKSKSPMMCLYDSVKDYCESLLGVRFTDEDRTFFKNHPATQSDGVPFPDTLRVAQELIEPYGLRISRVQTMPNFGVKGDLLQWRKVLGCNPLALGDRLTSNKEFIEKMNLVGKESPTQYRFEYIAEALHPAIACGIVYSSSDNITTGSTGGHATYIPPRRRVSGAMLSFQINRAELVPWKVVPVFPEVPEEQKKELEVFDLDEWWKKFRVTENSSYSYIPPNSGYGGPSKHLPVVVETKKVKSAKPECHMCNRKDKDRRHSLGYNGICDDCWMLFCSEHTCGTVSCEHSHNRPVPEFNFKGFAPESRAVYLQCKSCHRMYVVRWDTPRIKVGKRMISALEKYMRLQNLTVYDVANSTAEPSTNSTSPDPTPSGDTVVNDDSIPQGD